MRHDGKVFDTKLEAYVVGTDGKVGIPGRLVSKQGQMIAQSLLAGALGGIGQSLTRSKVPAININPGMDANLYESDSLSSIAQGGAGWRYLFRHQHDRQVLSRHGERDIPCG